MPEAIARQMIVVAVLQHHGEVLPPDICGGLAECREVGWWVGW